MADVIQAATSYRTRLKKELAKVEQFLAMAERFAKDGKASSASISPNAIKQGRVKEEYYAGDDHIDFIR